MVQPGIPGLDVPELVELTSKKGIACSVEGFNAYEYEETVFDDLWDALAYRNTRIELSTGNNGAVGWLRLKFDDVDRARFFYSFDLQLRIAALADLLPEAQRSRFALPSESNTGIDHVIVRVSGDSHLCGELEDGSTKEYTNLGDLNHDRKQLKRVWLKGRHKDGMVFIDFRSIDAQAGTFEFVVRADAEKLAENVRGRVLQRLQEAITAADHQVKRSLEHKGQCEAALAAFKERGE